MRGTRCTASGEAIIYGNVVFFSALDFFTPSDGRGSVYGVPARYSAGHAQWLGGCLHADRIAHWLDRPLFFDFDFPAVMSTDIIV